MTPLLLRLPHPGACRSDRFRARVRRLARREHLCPRALLARFAFKCDEQRFARVLLARATHLWLWRVDQAAGAGDFVVVDMSSPDPRRRRALAIDLKLGAELREGSSHQLRHRDAAVAALECTAATAATPWIGDGEAVLARLGSPSA